MLPTYLPDPASPLTYQIDCACYVPDLFFASDDAELSQGQPAAMQESISVEHPQWPLGGRLGCAEDVVVDHTKERLEASTSTSKLVLEECLGACECKPSLLPGGGHGLFAKRNLIAGAPIAVLSQGHISTQNKGNSVELEDGRFQAYPHPEGVWRNLYGLSKSPNPASVLGRGGCLANEAPDEAGRNAVIVEIRTPKVGVDTAMTSRTFTLLISTRAIDAGSEILTDYGHGEGWEHRVKFAFHTAGSPTL